jgi:hypothetical protein
MRVRIGAPHHLTLIFEDLDISNLWRFSQFVCLIFPGKKKRFDISPGKLRQGQIVPWRKTDNPAYTRDIFLTK